MVRNAFASARKQWPKKWGTLITRDTSEFFMCTGHQMNLTNSMEQNLSWKANRSSAGQEFPLFPKVYYRNHKRPLPAYILDQNNIIHNPPSHFLNRNFNIILPSTPTSSQWSLSLRFPHQKPVCNSLLPIRATCPAHLILLDFITWTINW